MRALACLLALGAFSCTPEPTDNFVFRLYTTFGHEDLLTAAGPANIIEMVVIQSDDPVGSQRKIDLQVASRSGKAVSLENGDAMRIYVRGFFGNDGPHFYGASAPFSAPPDTPVQIQVGPTDCVGANVAGQSNDAAAKEDMVEKRAGHTLTELADGRVLVVGGAELGEGESVTRLHASFEVFDPALSHFKTLGNLGSPRAWHTATRIGASRVLLVGGVDQTSVDGLQISTTADIVDLSGPVPVVTTVGSFDTGDERYRHAATSLEDGSVLIVGGLGSMGTPLASTYRYFPSVTADPRGGQFVKQGNLAEARSMHSLTALNRGNEPAVVAGGLGAAGALATLEVFTVNPQQGGCLNDQTPSARAGCWIRPTGRVLRRARFGHAAVIVDRNPQNPNHNWSVLFVGGYATEDRSSMARELEMLDGALEVQPGGDTLAFGRGELAAATLADGDVVVAGGRTGDASGHAVTTRLRRRVDEAGDLAGFAADDVDEGCDLGEARWGLQAIRLVTGTVLFTGGVSFHGMRGETVASRRAEVYFPRVVDLSTVYPSSP